MTNQRLRIKAQTKHAVSSISFLKEWQPSNRMLVSKAKWTLCTTITPATLSNESSTWHLCHSFQSSPWLKMIWLREQWIRSRQLPFNLTRLSSLSMELVTSLTMTQSQQTSCLRWPSTSHARTNAGSSLALSWARGFISVVSLIKSSSKNNKIKAFQTALTSLNKRKLGRHSQTILTQSAHRLWRNLGPTVCFKRLISSESNKKRYSRTWVLIKRFKMRTTKTLLTSWSQPDRTLSLACSRTLTCQCSLLSRRWRASSARTLADPSDLTELSACYKRCYLLSKLQ